MKAMREEMLKEDKLQYLAVDIIKQAVFDLNADELNDRKSSKEFFKGNWFADLCTISEIEPDILIRKINKFEKEREQ